MMNQGNRTTFRMLYYPPLGEAPLPFATRCGEHTDWSTFTLLTQDTEGGLEVHFSIRHKCEVQMIMTIIRFNKDFVNY